ncbi:MAG: carboxymuconolactone decarboxylase family protein [Novosphingobium sp.]
MVTVDELRTLARNAVATPGDPLDPLDMQLIRLAVAASVTSLSRDAIQHAVTEAFAAGASPAQIQEILSLVSGLGVHTLMVTARMVLDHARTAGFAITDTLTPQQQALWDQHVGNDPFWASFEKELPGFLRSMLLLSSDQFIAFFDYCAVPWKSRQVRARTKEIAAMACDATPAHRFLPGFRLHLANAVTLGAGHLAIEEALAIASEAPEHSGTC